MTLPELPGKLTDLIKRFSRIFSFSRREAVVIAVSVSVVLAAALIITVIALTAGGKSTAAVRDGKESADMQNIGSAVSDRPFLSDFIIYEDSLEESFTGLIYSREPMEQWSDEEIEEYWIDPKRIAADQLEKDVEMLVRDIFADVP